ncbi:hypothetical protein [Paenibacillus sp. FSL K6-2859]|uniref:hypothetical protein n=1 Tax=Paenibacillus sp. FSL K6-2859 TaxID=2921482 RepID=UPI0030FCBF9F
MQESKDIKYVVFGSPLSRKDLSQFMTLKTYVDTSHDTRALMQSPEGKLYLYSWHEEMGFPNDSVHEHYFEVDNQEQSDRYSRVSMIEIKIHLPRYIHVSPDCKVTGVGV